MAPPLGKSFSYVKCQIQAESGEQILWLWAFLHKSSANDDEQYENLLGHASLKLWKQSLVCKCACLGGFEQSLGGIFTFCAELGECIVETAKDPPFLSGIYEQFELLVNPIKSSASLASSGQVSAIVDLSRLSLTLYIIVNRLKFNLDKSLTLPCCIDSTIRQEPGDSSED